MTPLLVGLAFGAGAQDAIDCTNDDAYPIYGLSGYENGVAALRTNATTYGATAFAERNLFHLRPSEASAGIVLYELNLGFGVGRVPFWQSDAGWECPEAYAFSSRPLDIQSQNLGATFRFGRFGLYYSASVAMGAPGENLMMRTMGWSMAAPIYSAPLLALAPLFGSYDQAVGASAFAMDWVGGLTADLEVADLRAGYTRTRGLYLSAEDRYLGLFGTVLFRDGLKLVGQYSGGLERVGFGSASKTIGRSSLFARSLPLTDLLPGVVDDPTLVSLLTGHLEQTDLAGVLDVSVAYAVEPQPLVHTASVALHNPGYWRVRTPDGEEFVVNRAFFYGQVGMVRLPDQYYLGLEGGTYPTFKLETRGRAQGDGPETFEGYFMVLVNDPEQLSLFPFARGGLFIRYGLRGDF